MDQLKTKEEKEISIARRLWNIILKRSRLTIVLTYIIVTAFLIAVFYPLIPALMNYPPNNEIVSRKLGTSNSLQYFMVMSFAILAGTIYLFKVLKGFDNWGALRKENENDVKIINKIRTKCINLPYIIFLGQILVVNVPILFIGMAVTTLNNSSHIIVIKVVIMTFSLFSLAAVVSHTFTKKIYTRILLNTYIGGQYEGRRIGLRSKVFLQILPMIMVAILLTALIGYSRIISEKGDLLSSVYKVKINEKMDKINKYSDSAKVFKELKSIKVQNSQSIYFIKKADGTIITSDGSALGGYFEYYVNHPYEGYRMYDLNAETQGIVLNTKSIDGKRSIGVIFQNASEKTINYFIFGFLAMLLLNIFAIYYFSKSLSSDISLVAENLNEIAEGEFVDLDKKIPVTSNDEIGDLVVAFNKILDKEKEHIKEVEEQQAILLEQERLASLGHLIGGIAHNLRTPIMSLSGGIEGLKDLIKEYDESIDDENVTKEDHHEIAKEMRVWIEKMRPYCTYMSDIITAVKGQTIQPDLKVSVGFTIDELCKRVEILLEHELRNKRSKMIMDVKADRNIQIKGEISILIQVLNNLIINSVESYEGKGGNIDFIITNSDKTVEFIIKDYGTGIPEEIKKKLFKEMVTTKGSKGTGLGLYMSYSNIKARFGGKIRFESEKGKGTTFYIYIPYK